jgi:hypothetical protein
MPVRACLICSRPMTSYQRTVYLDSGAVVHAPCRRAFRGAATTSMAVIRPTSQAMGLRARERRGGGALYTETPGLVQRERPGGSGRRVVPGSEPDASAGPSRS